VKEGRVVATRKDKVGEPFQKGASAASNGSGGGKNEFF